VEILVIGKYALRVIATRHQMINRAGIFDSQRPSH
jgi:hypothetical protein